MTFKVRVLSCVVALAFLSTAQASTISISSIGGVTAGTTVTLDVSVSGTSGMHNSTVIDLTGSADGAAMLAAGSMGTTGAAIAALDSTGSIYGAFGTPQTFPPVFGYGNTTSISGDGKVFALNVSVPAGAMPGEVFTLTPVTSINTNIFDGVDPLKSNYTLIPGTITIVPEPSGLVILFGCSLFVALRRRR